MPIVPSIQEKDSPTIYKISHQRIRLGWNPDNINPDPNPSNPLDLATTPLQTHIPLPTLAPPVVNPSTLVPPANNPMSTQTPSTTTANPSEIKTALLGTFSTKPSEASRWLKAMNTYFLINPKVYHSNELKIALILSKMDVGKGVAFLEKWYDKMANTSVKPKEKTLAEFTMDYDQNFNPFNTKLKARRDLSKLVQRPGRDKDGTPNDRFQEYINKFKNLTTKAQFLDKLTTVTQFSTGLD